VVELERKLDVVWIGYCKVRVNRPKYSKDKKPRHGRNVDENKKDVLNRKNGQGPNHLKFFLLVFSKDEAQAQSPSPKAKPKKAQAQVQTMRGKAKH